MADAGRCGEWRVFMGIATVIITFIIPILYIFGGVLCIVRAPSYRCKGPAYKTRRAVLSRNTWHYANHNFGVVCIFIGVYIMVLTGLADSIFWRIGLRRLESIAYCVVAVVIQAVLLLLPFYNTEQHLKDFFDDEGKPLFEEKKHRFLNRKNEEDWESWEEPPEKEDDGWDDWQTWLHKRDIELDREREQREAEELRAASGSSEEEDDFFDEELEKLFAELESVVIETGEPEELNGESAGNESGQTIEETAKEETGTETGEETAKPDDQPESVSSADTEDTSEKGVEA